MRAPPTEGSALADLNDVRRHRPLLGVGRLELDLRTLGERLEAAAGQIAEVHEEILAAVLGSDEPEALGVVEPLDGSSCHKKHLLPKMYERVGGAGRPNSS